MRQAKQLVTSLFAAAPARVALRAAAMLRQQYTVVRMPTPALGGGLGADQLAAYAGDWFGLGLGSANPNPNLILTLTLTR